ncbi:MAG: hypothetical protein RL215_509 [Planctomycetota bacterium]
MASTADEDPGEGGDIAVIAAPGEQDVVREAELVVCGIEIEPMSLSDAGRDPGMRGISSNESLATWRGNGAEVTADVACGDSERAEHGDLEVSKILADAAFELEHLLYGCVNGSGGIVVGEFGVDACCEFCEGIEQGSVFRKGFSCPCLEIVCPGDAWGCVGEFEGFSGGCGI